MQTANKTKSDKVFSIHLLAYELLINFVVDDDDKFFRIKMDDIQSKFNQLDNPDQVTLSEVFNVLETGVSFNFKDDNGNKGDKCQLRTVMDSSGHYVNLIISDESTAEFKRWNNNVVKLFSHIIIEQNLADFCNIKPL